MPAKLIYSISDENPDLQKQIGCMNGIFQLFDRHHFLSGRRVNQNQKRLPPGQKDKHGNKPNNALQRPTEKELKKATKEKQRMSTESSRTSFSSSSCSSSLSSIDCNKQSQPEPSSYGQTTFPGTITRDLHTYQPKDSSQLRRQHVDLRNVVKDSMYREARGISIKTATKENAGAQTLKYMDSPRPVQQPTPVKSRVSGLNESFRVLGKLQEPPWSSTEKKEGFATKDAARFSYDGRESREAFKSTKLKELPRLSLDSRVRSMRGFTTELQKNYLPGDLQRGNANSHNILNQQQEPGSNKRPSTVVAKLMGLEAFPDSMSANENLPGQMKTSTDVECDSFSRISRTTDGNKQNRIHGSPRNSSKEPASPRIKNADFVKKPIASSKFPIEPAPWRQPDRSKGQTPALKCRETLAKAPISSPSVYGEIEKRLEQLEFKKSGKDLRALKQILEAMQKTKEILDSRKENQASNFVSRTGNNDIVVQSSKLADSKNLKISSNPTPTTIKGTSSPRSCKSPIVIMKAAKFIEKASDSASSVIPTESLSSLQRLRIENSTDSRKESVNKQMSKDPSPRTTHLRDPSSQLHPINKNSSAKTLRLAQRSKNPHPTTGKSITGKSSEPMNPRLQQKKLLLGTQSHFTTPSSDLSRTRRQPIESGSPHRKSRSQPSHLQQSDDQMSDISSDTRDLSQQGDASSLQSECNTSTASHADIEVTSIDRYDKIHGAFFQQHSQKDPAARYNEDKSMAEPARVGPEQPSPVSVLDATFYRDEPPSPVKKISHPFKDEEDLNCGEAEWSLMDTNQLSNCRKPSSSSEDYRKVKSTWHLDTNVMHINATHEKSIIDEIAPIYNGRDANHRYISEILLASGLLRDFESSFMTVQPHPSGHLINPDLFLVLEQTKSSTRLLNDEHKGKMVTHSESAIEKTQRKLVFDAVNEILAHKIALARSSKPWFSTKKLADKEPRRLQLLRDLCSEVDHLQVKNLSSTLDDEDDILRKEDLMHGSIDWTGCQSEIPWLVLDVERLIFKDLISEIVHKETAGLRGQPGRHCRQLFSK